ncbi:hypothetical protein [Pigmentiphaga litoralis]|uniref:hypothetical protein n=1 Tax=Pigmentiphaga litoralis TaxID=516702 RepID=UPI003B43AA64
MARGTSTLSSSAPTSRPCATVCCSARPFARRLPPDRQEFIVTVVPILPVSASAVSASPWPSSIAPSHVPGAASSAAAHRVTSTTCPYCGVGCGVQASVAADGKVTVAGDPTHPSNFGRLCVKGSALGETVGLEGRLLHPCNARRMACGACRGTPRLTPPPAACAASSTRMGPTRWPCTCPVNC